MKNTKWLIILVGLVLVTLLIIKLEKPKSDNFNKRRNKPALKVDAYIVKPSLLINEITVSGTLMANEEVELKNEVAGRIVKLNLQEGKFVKEGTLLVKLFDDDLQADLKKLQTQLAIQQQIYNRQSELLKVNGISQNDYEQTGLQLNSIKAEIEVQKVKIRKTEVLAPFDGVIGLRNVSVGAQVTPSTLLATIRSIDQLKLDFSVPEKYSPEIVPGMKVKFTVYESKKAYDATVIASERGIDPYTRNMKVRALVNSKSNQLIPGSFTNVQLRMNENKHALVIPTQSIIPNQENKTVIIAKNGKAHFTEVKTGIRKVSYIEITNGLQPGDTVITNGILFLKEGSPLKYATVKTDSL